MNRIVRTLIALIVLMVTLIPPTQASVDGDEWIYRVRMTYIGGTWIDRIEGAKYPWNLDNIEMLVLEKKVDYKYRSGTIRFVMPPPDFSPIKFDLPAGVTYILWDDVDPPIRGEGPAYVFVRFGIDLTWDPYAIPPRIPKSPPIDPRMYETVIGWCLSPNSPGAVYCLPDGGGIGISQLSSNSFVYTHRTANGYGIPFTIPVYNVVIDTCTTGYCRYRDSLFGPDGLSSDFYKFTWKSLFHSNPSNKEEIARAVGGKADKWQFQNDSWVYEDRGNPVFFTYPGLGILQSEENGQKITFREGTPVDSLIYSDHAIYVYTYKIFLPILIR